MCSDYNVIKDVTHSWSTLLGSLTVHHSGNKHLTLQIVTFNIRVIQAWLYQPPLGDGYTHGSVIIMKEEKIHTIEDYCHSVITHRYRQSIDLRKHPAYEEMIKDIKSKLPKRLLSNHSNISKVIVGVGDELFGS